MSAATMLKNVVESLEGAGNPLEHVYVQARLQSFYAFAAKLCGPHTLSILTNIRQSHSFCRKGPRPMASLMIAKTQHLPAASLQ